MGFMRCNACGIVFDGEVSLFTSCMNLHCPGLGDGQFSLIGAWAAEWGATGDQFTQLALSFRQTAAIIITNKRTVIDGVEKISYKGKGGRIGQLSPHLAKRDLVRVLERIRDGKKMQPDADGHVHKNWGSCFENAEQVLPVTGDTKYYGEFGVDITIGPAGERHFTGERIVVGKCREYYYTSHHYEVGSWWVFNTGNGQWCQFER